MGTVQESSPAAGKSAVRQGLEDWLTSLPDDGQPNAALLATARAAATEIDDCAHKMTAEYVDDGVVYTIGGGIAAALIAAYHKLLMDLTAEDKGGGSNGVTDPFAGLASVGYSTTA